MIMCKVIGSIVSTIKHDSFKNQKIMLVKPINPDGTLKSGTMIAIDTVCAGVGDLVLVASEGRSAVELLGFSKREPLRSVIVGVIDTIDISKNINS